MQGDSSSSRVAPRDLVSKRPRGLHHAGGRPIAAVAVLAIYASLAGNATLAQPQLQPLHNHVRPEVIAGKAQFAGTVPEDQRLNFSIVLPLRNEAELNKLLVQLYDP
jgi:hypothetical protein